MLKKLTSLCLLFCFTLTILTSCSPKPNEPAAQSSSPIVVTDQIGREVTLPAKPEKIVSSYYITTSLLIALEAQDQLVGIEMKANEREIYKKAAPKLLELPAVGSGKGLNIEQIAALSPDLVIIPSRLQDSVEQLETLNIPVIVVEPETIDQFMDCVTLLGQAIGKEERASQLMGFYQDTMSMVNGLTQNITQRPNVYLSGSGDILTTCTSKMVQNDIIQMAGGNNVSSQLTDGYWTTISTEQLLAWNPDYILPVSYASYTTDDIRNNPALAGVNAIKNNHVFLFPSAIEPWDYPTPSSILGILWLTSTLHPDLYSPDEYLKVASNFYKTYFNIDVTAEELGVY